MSSPLRSSVSPIKAAQLAAPGQEGLDFDAAGLTALRNAGSEELLIEDFPTAPGATGRLVLKRFEVAAPGARISLTGPDGDSFLPLPSVAHFSGRVDGDPDSTVYVGALPDRLVAYVHTSAGHSYVGPDESNVSYVVRMADSPLNATQTEASWSCAADQLPAALTATAQPSYPAAGLPDVAGFKQALVRIETDNQLYVHFGNSADNVGAYVLTLFGVINTVYEHDLDMHLTVSDVHLWTMADPYTGADTLTQLLQLGDWWHANRPIATYPRTYVHYLSGHPVSGGIAWVGVLCSGDFPTGPDYGGGYGLTQVYGTYPLQLWDQYASAHEMGHNFGSPHTHCYSPPIDQCYGSETPAPPCYSGMPHNPGTGNGTIMSYCHLLGWQYVSLVFHPRCITEKMLPEIASSSCLASIPTFPDVPNTDPFFHAIETIYELGITSGCTPPNFCPNDPVSRAQMAVFLLRSKFGVCYVPPPATGTVFTDVPSSSFAAGRRRQGACCEGRS